MEIGTRVKLSEYAIRPKRDWWNQCGREPMKTGARDALDKAIAQRGTIIESDSTGVTVQWDNGIKSDCLSYMVTAAEKGAQP